MGMKNHTQLYFILLILTLTFFNVANAKKTEPTKAASLKAAAAKTEIKPATKYPRAPPLKSDEYAIFMDDAYKIFKTQND